MRSIHGKIILVLMLCYSSLLSAGVKASLDRNEIYRGESATLTITAEGESVKFPDIRKIGGFDVMGISDSQSTTIVNGAVSHTKSKSYTFAPSKSVKIPPFSVEIDAKVYKSEPLDLKVVKPSASKNGAPFILRMELQKDRVKVGESVRLDLLFKQKRGAKADKIELSPLKLENFWVKEIKGVKQSLEGDYIVSKYSYLLFPQKAGDFKIDPVTANIGVRVKRRNSLGGFSDPFFDDPFFNSFISSLEWKKVFSNGATIHVEPLPGDLEVYGSFDIKAVADKNETSAGKPVNLTITIEGEGNVDDIGKFEIDIPDAVVYSDEPKITSGLKEGRYFGRFTQKIAIIADRDFVIPSLEFKYFDKNEQKIVTKKTVPIAVKVKGGAKNQTPLKIERSKQLREAFQKPGNQKTGRGEKDTISGYLYLFAGMVLGFLLSYVFAVFKKREKKREREGVTKLIKRAKSDKELYDLLLAYASDDHPYLKDILSKLEENIYKGKNNAIDTDEIVDFFEESGIE